jgi:heat shock protein HtpX
MIRCARLARPTYDAPVSHTTTSALDQLGDRVGSRLGHRLVDRLTAEERPARLALSRVLTYLLVLPVHAITLGFLAGGAVLLAKGDNWPIRILGVFLLLVAVGTGPRLHRRPTGDVLDQQSCPQFTELVAEAARLAGCRPPREVVISPQFNASAGVYGLNRRVLEVGAPLWAVLTPGGRAALLGHELGHFAHGDLLQGRAVAWARQTLVHWHDVATPLGTVARGYGGLALVLMRVLLVVPRLLIEVYLMLLDVAIAPSHRRQEHLADLAAVSAGGTEGAVELLEVLLNVDGFEVTANTAAIRPDRPDIFRSLQDRADSYSPDQRRNLRLHGEREKSRIDASRPATYLRLRLVEARPQSAPRIVLDGDRIRAIDAELQPAMQAAFTALGEHHRHVR